MTIGERGGKKGTAVLPAVLDQDSPPQALPGHFLALADVPAAWISVQSHGMGKSDSFANAYCVAHDGSYRSPNQAQKDCGDGLVTDTQEVLLHCRNRLVPCEPYVRTRMLPERGRVVPVDQSRRVDLAHERVRDIRPTSLIPIPESDFIHNRKRRMDAVEEPRCEMSLRAGNEGCKKRVCPLTLRRAAERTVPKSAPGLLSVSFPARMDQGVLPFDGEESDTRQVWQGRPTLRRALQTFDVNLK